MGSGEIKKETGAGSPSMTAKNVTPLTPLTPLKWKSNVREQEEEEKAMERSRLRSTIPVGTIHEKYPEGNPAPDYGKEERPAEGRQTIVGVANDRTNTAEEHFSKTQPGNIDKFVSLESLEGPDRYYASIVAFLYTSSRCRSPRVALKLWIIILEEIFRHLEQM